METSDDEEEEDLSDSAPCELDCTPGSQEEACTSKFQDISSSSELKSVLAPFFEKEKIDKKYLDILEREKMDARCLAESNMEILNMLFPDMPIGDKMRLLKIFDRILQEEKTNSPFRNISSNKTKQKEDNILVRNSRGISEGEEENSETKFKEIFRTFDTQAKAADAYRKHAVFETSNVFISDLIEPLHRFRHIVDQDESSLSKLIAIETVKFAGACFSDRTNGTIHFGILENKGLDGLLEGKVVGLQINQIKFMDIFYEEIQQCFYKDQLDIVLQCLRPPQFVMVRDKERTNEGRKTLFVIEIDVIPSYGLTNCDTFYIREKDAKHEPVPCIYKFDKNVPKVLNGDDLKNYMSAKSRIAENRKHKEMSSLPKVMYKNLREQFLGFYTGGHEKLTNDIYPILFLSPLDSAMNEEFVSENFEFLLDMEPSAIFDFHSSLDKKCLYNFVEADLEKVVKVFTTDNFDRNSEENISCPDRLNGNLDEVSTGQIKPWIFCNGYEPLDKPPLNRLEWKKRRSEGFKEVTRFLQQEIPNERALVIFMILSKNYDIMLEVAEEVILKFQNQWIAMAENEKLMKTWQEELLRRDTVDKKMLNERCIIGLPWKHLNNIVKEVSNSLPMASKCQLPTSAGAFCYLKDKTKNDLCDLEILSSNECEVDVIPELESLRRLEEEKFYRGGQVTWWNLHFQDHVLRRSQQEKIQQGIEELLEPKQTVEDSRVSRFYLLHQPGAGGTTTALYTLWQFRKRYRCCVIKKITDQTFLQIERFRCFEDLENPKPPIILIDNEDEEKVQDLYARLEHKAKTDSRTTYCVLFLCARRPNLPVSVGPNTVQLKHELSQEELDWLERKYQELIENYKKYKEVNPQLLISFNILKENFDSKYIERTVKQFVDSIDVEKERELIKYLSLLNAFDIDFQSIPLSAFDQLMTEGTQTTSMGSVSVKRTNQTHLNRHWEQTLSQSAGVLLNRNARFSSGGQALSIVSKLFANAILEYIIKKENISVGNIMLQFLYQPLLRRNDISTRQLKKIINDVLKKRDVTEDHKKERFSPIILKIEENEGKDKVAEVLETGYSIILDPMLAQQTARFFISVANWEKAEKYAKDAVESKPDSSYLWDTYGQIYKKRLTDKYKSLLEDGGRPSVEEIIDITKLAMKGIDKFSKEQDVSEKTIFGRENDAGYFGEIRLIVQLLDLLYLWFPEEDKSELHAYFVNTESYDAFQTFPDECRTFLKKIYERSEKTMQVIEDKLAQLKDDRESDVFPLKASYNPRYEIVQIRENLDNYFGEHVSQVPVNLSQEAKASFIRRRVKRIGGRSISSILDLQTTPNGEIVLNEMQAKLLENTSSHFPMTYDFVTLISVTIVKNMTRKSFQDEDFKNLVEWSRTAYDLTVRQGDNKRPHLEAFMYFVMIHWPTDSKRTGKYKLSPIENVENAVKKWKIAFQKLYTKQRDDAYSARCKETTYFFLGKGGGLKEIVYYKDLKCKQTNLNGEALWRSKYVKEKLQPLEGTLLSDGWEILHPVVSLGGNKSSIKVQNSYPSPKSMWQKKVVFYLGFSWSGPKAYIRIDPHSEEAGDQSNRMTFVEEEKKPQIPRNPSKSNWHDVTTHETFLRTERELKRQLQEIKWLRKKEDINSEEKQKIQQEVKLEEELAGLVKRRCEFVDRQYMFQDTV